MTKKLWINNPLILLSNYSKFLPNENNAIDNSNNLARLAIYLYIFINITSINNKNLSLPIIILIISYFIVPLENFIQKQKQLKKTKLCTKPTKNNPFMNFTIGDLIKNPIRKPACKLTKKIRNKITKKFLYNKNSYDVTDFFNRKSIERQFYTMPVTTITNEQKNFAIKLYGSMGNCKSNGKNCLKYKDLKSSRSRWINI